MVPLRWDSVSGRAALRSRTRVLGITVVGAAVVACLVLNAPNSASGSQNESPENFGFALSGVGDVDKDGTPDIAVGAPRAGRESEGRVIVVSGKSGKQVWTLDGTDLRGMLGYAVASPGDVDEDGIPDVVAGAPFAMRRTGTDANPGKICVGGLVLLISGKSGRVVTVIGDEPGTRPGERFGAAVAAIAGTSGGPPAQVLVGAPGLTKSGGEQNWNGNAYLYPAKGGRVTLGFGAAGFWHEFGASVAVGGDYNADGIPDVLVGAPGDGEKGQKCPGEVGLFSGKNRAPLHTFRGIDPASRFGSAITLLALSAGETLPSIVVGAPGAIDTKGKRCGAVMVFSMPSKKLRLTAYGEAEGDEFGASLAPTGDVNGDGIPDLIVGSPNALRPNAGKCGSLKLLSGGDGKVLRSWFGTGAGDRFGAAVAVLPGSGEKQGPIAVAGAPLAGQGQGELQVFPVDGSSAPRSLPAFKK